MTGKKVTIILSIFGIAVLLTVSLVAFQLYQTGFWKGPDKKFGDQNLKSSVALIELHKVRFGHYPKNLSELKYLGDWDPIWVRAVSYHPNKELTQYCIVVERGWVGKPNLDVPAEFWQGTGYDSSLCPHE